MKNCLFDNIWFDVCLQIWKNESSFLAYYFFENWIFWLIEIVSQNSRRFFVCQIEFWFTIKFLIFRSTSNFKLLSINWYNFVWCIFYIFVIACVNFIISWFHKVVCKVLMMIQYCVEILMFKNSKIDYSIEQLFSKERNSWYFFIKTSIHNIQNHLYVLQNVFKNELRKHVDCDRFFQIYQIWTFISLI